jgi:AcrR family transcriptional regulator
VGTGEGRPNQRLRTRKDLLQAASRLLKQSRNPSLEEVAAEAMVSRATAYRYFPDVQGLLAEAALDVSAPGIDDLFAHDTGVDPVARMERVDTALHDLVLANEPQMRTMLANAVMRVLADEGKGALPVRQNRRTPLIEAALQPARARFTPTALRRLSTALALIIGTEGVIVCKDVLRIDDAEARRVKRWAIRVLIEAASRSR